ncbi:glycoside hydrolase family 99-like domain-containing protein [uncultured Dysgonomonas sp.]|uniref:Lipopolysaccharide biosynthesis protein n=1 Tax=uncultured Dysgonomonas sp. TaxID=206096 RepID=A0A212J8I0_9BACT|nr:glycoside hydrolase family 99-like domain-containing protein [uncultured Dysgonomonas sp.]SBV95753.1 conserved hypothetical protein [uncultured Dysgonomonas sp.]
MESNKARVIAYYLPQFHPIPENDEWWGKGFTEWTNVGKARPLFKGHYQPLVPADLGYYDLRIPEVREEQAKLAKEAGIEGFCYWHYWFGDGKRLLEMPFNEVVSSGKPDFPFCLGWANESWQAKVWNREAGENRTLIEQKYPGEKDNEDHFYELLPAFQDKRYIRVDGNPFFLIYKPLQFPGVSDFIKQWNALLKKNNVGEKFYFVANAYNEDEYLALKQLGFDAVTINPSSRMIYKSKIVTFIRKVARRLFNVPIVVNYSSVIDGFTRDIDKQEDVIPFILPNWDHSPRSAKRAIVLHKSTPQLFQKHVKKVFDVVEEKENKLVILKSWNEWGEGNYMEPDLKWGKGYLEAVKSYLIKKIEF